MASEMLGFLRQPNLRELGRKYFSGEKELKVMARWFVLALVGLFGTGCAGLANKPFAPSTSVDSVVVLKVQEYDAFLIENYSATLIGLAVTKGAYQEKLRKSISDAKFDFSGEFTKELVTALTSVGLKVETVSVKRQGLELLDSYEGIQTSAQAVLDISPGAAGVAYHAGTPSRGTDYRPSLSGLKVVLVDKATGEVLYSEHIKYGNTNSLISGTELAAAEGTYFRTAEELIKDDNAARGLRVAIRHISRFIAEKLQNGNAQARAALK